MSLSFKNFFVQTGVGLKEGVTETIVKVEQNKGRLLIHMLEGKRRKGSQLEIL